MDHTNIVYYQHLSKIYTSISNHTISHFTLSANVTTLQVDLTKWYNSLSTTLAEAYEVKFNQALILLHEPREGYNGNIQILWSASKMVAGGGERVEVLRVGVLGLYCVTQGVGSEVEVHNGMAVVVEGEREEREMEMEMKRLRGVWKGLEGVLELREEGKDVLAKKGREVVAGIWRVTV
jgi:hypothetical protein